MGCTLTRPWHSFGKRLVSLVVCVVSAQLRDQVDYFWCFSFANKKEKNKYIFPSIPLVTRTLELPPVYSVVM